MTCDVWRLAYTCHRVLVTLACILVLALCALPPIEKIHNKWWLSSTTLSPLLDDGQKIGDTEYDSPDFRVEEPLLLPLNKYREEHRPYRLSPHYKMASRLSKYDYAYQFGCVCCLVYKRLTPLATCTVLTTRHLLSTASATELVLRGHRNLRSLENILGAWYDNNMNVQNSSFYASIARIHYHPEKEWGWFICVKGYPWARYGMDSGAAAFRSFDGNAVRQEGLVGIHTVAMKLRSVVLNLYYTVLDTHNILDFLYSAYLGRLPYEYLDYRFIDSQWTAPRAYAWAWIIHDYTLGEEWDFEIPRW